MANPSLASLALGRILRLASRPAQPGDVAEYERCRAIIMDELEPVAPDYSPSWVRDRLEGRSGGRMKMDLWETLDWWKARYGTYPGWVEECIAARCLAIAARLQAEAAGGSDRG